MQPMNRAKQALLASAAMLAGVALLPMGAGGQEFKGQVKLGVHKVKLEQGKIYRVILAKPPTAPLHVDCYPTPIYRLPGFNEDDTLFIVPNKTGEHVLAVNYIAFGTPPAKDTYDYSLKVTGHDLEEKPLLSVEDKLTAKDPQYRGEDKYHKPYKLPMKAGKIYVIDMVKLVKNGVTDPYLFLEDAKGTPVASDDDGLGDHNARIIFSPPKDGDFTIIATTLGKETGGFTLTVRSTK
jgi:hypothetical protein